MADSQYPFGNPDAARVDLRSFLAIEGVVEDPKRNQDSTRDRLIIGRKGSGKTFYLRKLCEDASQKSLLTLAENDSLDTELVRFILKRIRDYVYSMDRESEMVAFVDRRSACASMWKSLWDRAILVSAVSLYLYHIRKEGKFEIAKPEMGLSFRSVEDFEEFCSDQFEGLFDMPFGQVSPQAALRDMSVKIESARLLHRFLNDKRWNELQGIFKGLINEVPPMVIYIDVMDSEFEDAPEAWLLCQMGLYRSISQSGFNSDAFSGRLHVVAALRDIVYSSLLRSEHGARYYQNRQVKIIQWDKKAIRTFFSLKAKSAQATGNKRYLRNEDDRAIFDWIGFQEITVRNVKENVVDYILRHSRMLPRDIVVFGNEISAAIKTAKDKQEAFTEKDLRRAVSSVASLIGNETIEICINETISSAEHFASFSMSSGFREGGLLDYKQFLLDKLGTFFDACKNEVVDISHLRETLVSVGLANGGEFAEGSNPYFRFDNILWRHGLVAIQQELDGSAQWQFNWNNSSNMDIIPRNAAKVGFHASLIDVYGIRPSSAGPVF